MQIAVPLVGGIFSQHFGQSTAFWICSAEGNPAAISRARELSLPEAGGCAAIPAILSNAGVTLVIAGGMGAGAVTNLARFGINVITGVVTGTPQQIVEDYVAGRLTSTGQTCSHHDAHHEHGNGDSGGCHRHGSEE